ncbi:MAG TPA: sn-glycerol-3-phosphate transporter [Burkholderiales bacterium]|nr:sn-glycerol-3-phosphate transporter [Burkholderiales bacterium]
MAAQLAAAADSAAPDGRLTLVFGPYVYHYHDNEGHNDQPWLTGLEWGPQGWPVDFGAVYFRNSFSQDSAYAYVGKRWFYDGRDHGVYLKLTGGPLYGYRDQYESKVPFNHNGLGWAIIPGIGYQYRAVDAQLVILGGAALMVTFGYDFRE